MIGFRSTIKGLDKLQLDASRIEQDLNENWAVVAEALQTILRREGYPNPYECLKELTRTNDNIDEEVVKAFIEKLDVSDAVKKELKAVTPLNYTGIKL